MLVFFVDASSYDGVNPDVNDNIQQPVFAEFQTPLSPTASSYHSRIQLVILYQAFSFLPDQLGDHLSDVLGQVSFNPFESGLMIHKLGMLVNPSLPPLTDWYQQEPRNSNSGGQGAFGNQVLGSGLGKLNSKDLSMMEVGGQLFNAVFKSGADRHLEREVRQNIQTRYSQE